MPVLGGAGRGRLEKLWGAAEEEEEEEEREGARLSVPNPSRTIFSSPQPPVPWRVPERRRTPLRAPPRGRGGSAGRAMAPKRTPTITASAPPDKPLLLLSLLYPLLVLPVLGVWKATKEEEEEERGMGRRRRGDPPKTRAAKANRTPERLFRQPGKRLLLRRTFPVAQLGERLQRCPLPLSPHLLLLPLPPRPFRLLAPFLRAARSALRQ